MQVWLSQPDRQRLDRIARTQGKTKSEFGRDAIRAALDAADRVLTVEHDTEIARALKQLENRLGNLIVKVAIDAGTVRNVLWERTDPRLREGLFSRARAWAVKTLRNPERHDGT